MKIIRYIYLITASAALLSAGGCKGFLEEYSLTDLRPGTVQDIQALMMGEAYPSNYTMTEETPFAQYLELLTDDVESSFTENAAIITDLLHGAGPFTWHPAMFRMMEESGVATDSYELYYSHIKGCNVVLDELPKVSGSEAEKGEVRGEALALRAYYYLMLVNLFGQPYNAAGVDIATSPGVPLILESKVTDLDPVRASVKAVYDQIEKDLKEAGELLTKYGQKRSKFHVSPAFVHAVLSRVYLYQEKWEQAAEQASLGLAINPVLIKLANMTMPSASGTLSTPIYAANSDETIWLHSHGWEFRYFSYFQSTPSPYSQKPAFYVSQSLKDVYDYDLTSADNRKDLRPTMYYVKCRYLSLSTYDLWYGSKVVTASVGGKGVRVAELYLNRAEALAQRFIATGDAQFRTQALADLNFLREYRYDTRNVAYQPVDIADGNELLSFCRDERRRELCYEEHRWFDLRRYGMPEIRHTFRGSTEEQAVEHVLAAGDKRYVLPIPETALAKNPNLVPNP